MMNERSSQIKKKKTKNTTIWLAKESLHFRSSSVCMSQKAGTVDKVLKDTKQEIKHKIQKEKKKLGSSDKGDLLR